MGRSTSHQVEELAAQRIALRAGQTDDFRGAEARHRRIAFQILAEGGHGGCESGIGGRFTSPRQQFARHRLLQQEGRSARRLLVADLDEQRLRNGGGLNARRPVRGVTTARRDIVGRWRDLVKRRDLVPRPDVTGVDPVVVEVAFGQLAVLISDLALGADRGRIELDLRLHVLGNDLKRA